MAILAEVSLAGRRWGNKILSLFVEIKMLMLLSVFLFK